LMNYVTIFLDVPFPLDPAGLIQVVRKTIRQLEGQANDESRIVAMTLARSFTALENVRHPAVRAFALEMVESNTQTGRAAWLLTKNWEDGDWALVESLTMRELDAEDYHSLEISVRHIGEAHPSPEAVNSLLNLYERGPCSFCREHVVELLDSLDALPEWV